MPATRFIRSANDNDMQVLAAIERRISPLPWTEHQFRESLDAHVVIIMEFNGVTAGYLVYSRTLDEVELLNLGVDLPFRRSGIGRQLLDYCINENRNFAVRIYLEVRAGNLPAINLYTGAGFVQVGARKGYYQTARGAEDAEVMAYDYSPARP